MDNQTFTTNANFASTGPVENYWGDDLATWSESVLLEKDPSTEPKDDVVKTFDFEHEDFSPSIVSYSAASPSVEALSNPFDRSDKDS